VESTFVSRFGIKSDINNPLISFGDCLQPGIFTLHSKFQNVINYVRDNGLVSLVTAEIGNGPANIVLQHLSFKIDSRVTVSDNFVTIDQSRFNLIPKKMFISKLSYSSIDLSSFENRLCLLEKEVRRCSHLKSYVFLIDETRKKHFVSSFEKALVERVQTGWDYFLRKDISTGMHLIMGSGFGFTPSGDDFIAGISAGMSLIRNLYEIDVGEEVDTIYLNSTTGNVVSRNFIFHALKGHFLEKIKDMLQSLITGDENELVHNSMNVIALGQTSGADFLCGLICSFKMHEIIH
jgi:hypothetical protein